MSDKVLTARAFGAMSQINVGKLAAYASTPKWSTAGFDVIIVHIPGLTHDEIDVRIRRALALYDAVDGTLCEPADVEAGLSLLAKSREVCEYTFDGNTHYDSACGKGYLPAVVAKNNPDGRTCWCGRRVKISEGRG